MTPAEAWLREHEAGVPPALAAAMRAAVGDEEPVPEALAAAALRLLEALEGGGERREDAYTLLAADALLTCAFEAQAELDPAGIPGLAERYGPAGGIGALPATAG